MVCKSLSLSLCVSATKKANTATFFLPGCPKRKTHKLVRHFYKRLGYCSQKQPCKSSRTAGVAVVQLYYVRGVCDHLVTLSLSLSSHFSLPLECNKFPHGSTSITLPSTNSLALCKHSSKRISYTFTHFPVAPPSLRSLVIPMLAFLPVSALLLWIVVVISSSPMVSSRSLSHCRYSCSCNGYSKAASYTGHLPILAYEASSHTQGMVLKLQV
jgi:hypothetical protein